MSHNERSENALVFSGKLDRVSPGVRSENRMNEDFGSIRLCILNRGALGPSDSENMDFKERYSTQGSQI